MIDNQQPPNEWGKRLHDVILDNSALRDGLTDSEAQPLIDWGLALATRVTYPLVGMPSDEAEARYDELYGAIPKLMTRINWAITYREKKGAEWVTKTLHKVNDLNQTIQGQDAPQLDEESMQRYADVAIPRGEVVLALIRDLSPLDDGSPTPPGTHQISE